MSTPASIRPRVYIQKKKQKAQGTQLFSLSKIYDANVFFRQKSLVHFTVIMPLESNPTLIRRASDDHAKINPFRFYNESNRNEPQRLISQKGIIFWEQESAQSI